MRQEILLRIAKFNNSRHSHIESDKSTVPCLPLEVHDFYWTDLVIIA